MWLSQYSTIEIGKITEFAATQNLKQWFILRLLCDPSCVKVSRAQMAAHTWIHTVWREEAKVKKQQGFILFIWTA
jgi:hypothetical protein